MKILVFYTSVLLCSSFAKQSRHYEVHNRFKRQTNKNHATPLENERNMPLRINSEQFSEYTGAAQHRGQSPLHTDQARHIIHFPQQQAKEDTRKDSFEVTQAQTERHILQGNELTELYMNGIKVNASLLNEFMNVGDVKLAPSKRSSFQIHNVVQPVTKVIRTVYINGVKVENNENIGSIINALLNQHTSSSSSSVPGEDSNKELLNVNTNSNYNQQIPMFILNKLNNNPKPDSTAGQRDYISENSESNHSMQIPDLDIRLGGLDQHSNGKLAKLREKGRNIKNATSIPDKQHRNQHIHVKPRDLAHFVTQDVKHKSVDDGIIFL